MATYIKIATVTVGAGGQAAMEFTSIPSTYTDLLVVNSGRDNSGNSTFTLRFNGSTTGYSQRRLVGNGSAASSSTDASSILILSNDNSATANTFSNVSIYVPNYAGSSNKSVSSDSVTENNGTTAYAWMGAGLWSNTAAITSISLLTTSWLQYSTATLYGIKKS